MFSIDSHILPFLDPFYEIATPVQALDGSTIWQRVYRSEHVADNLNPVWKTAEIEVDLLCHCELDRPLKVSIFDWEASGKHNPMGHFLTSVNGLLEAKARKEGDKWDTSKSFTTIGEDGKDYGKIVVSEASMESRKDAAISSKLKVSSSSILHLTLEGVDMANVEGWFGCSGK